MIISGTILALFVRKITKKYWKKKAFQYKQEDENIDFTEVEFLGI